MIHIHKDWKDKNSHARLDWCITLSPLSAIRPAALTSGRFAGRRSQTSGSNERRDHGRDARAVEGDEEKSVVSHDATLITYLAHFARFFLAFDSHPTGPTGRVIASRDATMFRWFTFTTMTFTVSPKCRHQYAAVRLLVPRVRLETIMWSRTCVSSIRALQRPADATAPPVARPGRLSQAV